MTMYVKKYCVTLMLLLFGIGVGYAQENRTEMSIDFRVNSTYIDSAYSNNAEAIDQIVEFLREIRQDSTISIVNVTFNGAASPEGNFESNRRLAQGRLAALERVVRRELIIPDSIITHNDCYINWEYLTSQVEHSKIAHKDEVISILKEDSKMVDYHLPNRHIDHRIIKLKNLDGGKVWQQMHNQFFTDMRNAQAVIITYKQERPSAEGPVIVSDALIIEAPLSMNIPSIVKPDITKPERKPFYMAIKNNLLLDIALIPNIGAEFYLGRNWSVVGNWMYSWWKSDTKHNYWRTYGGDLAFRKWFGRRANEKPLTGHHLGAYGQMLTYDFELGGRGYLAADWVFSGGLEYGYALPIGKRFNLDFTIGVGYHGGEYKEYIPLDGHYVWQVTKNRRWFGPTKLEASIVWLIGYGNENSKFLKKVKRFKR